jgi:uncharacterized DUF497 family protein
MKISSFDWDDGNKEKLKKHQVPLESIEDFFASSKFHIISDQGHSFNETRFVAFGTHEERYLFIVFTFRAQAGILKIRVISARYFHTREARKLYEKIKN